MSAPHSLSDKTLDEGRCFFVCYNKKGGLYINKLFSKKCVHHLLIVWECEQVSRNVKLGQNVQKIVNAIEKVDGNLKHNDDDCKNLKC